MEVKTICSSGNNKLTKRFEQSQNEQLIKLYEEFQKNPFQAAKIDYYDNGKTKVTFIREKQSTSIIKKLAKKLISLIKK